MSEIKRFEPELVDFNDFAMTQYPNGDWVTYEDHQAKIDSLQAALAASPTQEPVAEKAAVWFNALSRIATLLEMPEDQPIIQAVDVLENLLKQPAQELAISNETIQNIVVTLNNFARHPHSQKVIAVKEIIAAQQPAQEPALPKATIMPSTLKEPIQVPVSEPTALSVSWHVSKQPAPEPVKQESWMPIETAPKNTKIIVRYKNEYGNDRTVFAKYIEKFTEESSCDSENDEYDEATDTYYLKEGWLELIENWDEFSSVYFDSRNIITGWMPAPPVEAQP